MATYPLEHSSPCSTITISRRPTSRPTVLFEAIHHGPKYGISSVRIPCGDVIPPSSSCPSVPRPSAFPGHQPEFDGSRMKASVNTYLTEYRAGYCRHCQRALAPDDPAWSSKTKVCLHCKDRTYTIDPNPEPYTLTIDYPQNPAAKGRCIACQEINNGVKMN